MTKKSVFQFIAVASALLCLFAVVWFANTNNPLIGIIAMALGLSFALFSWKSETL